MRGSSGVMNAWRGAALAALLALCGVPPAQAAGAPVAQGRPVAIDLLASGGTGWDVLGGVAQAGDGSAVVAWEAERGFGQAVRIRRIAADGTPLDPVLAAEPAADGTAQYDAGVAADAEGNFVAIWNQQTRGAVVPRLRAFHADGTPRGAALCLEPGCGAEAQGFAFGNRSLAMDAAGDFVAVWRALGKGAYHLRRFARDGTPLDARPRAVATAGDPDGGGVAVAMNRSSGSFAVAWDEHQTYLDTRKLLLEGDTIFLQRFGADGRPQGRVVRVNGCAAARSHAGLKGCSIAGASIGLLQDDAGDSTVLWSQYDGRALNQYARRYSPTGAPLGDRLRLAGAPSGLPLLDLPQAAHTAKDGAFVCAWWSITTLAAQGQSVSASGLLDGPAFAITPAGVAASGLALSANRAGDVTAVWSGADGLFAQRYAMP